MINFNVSPYTGNEIKYIQQAIESHKICGDGEFTKRCNAWMEKRFQARKAFLTTSGSSALDIAALLCDIKPGDEVILPSYTFSSTANAFVLAGAKLVFVDIRPDTMNIDENKIEEAITDRTKVICVVHYAGVACEMDTIMKIAKKYDLMVVEDAAQAIFSYIIMPAFVIMVLSQFIYQPIIRNLGELWHAGKYAAFKRRVFKQYILIAGLTAIVILGGALLGIPVLSMLYNADLAAYKQPFLVLLLGGGVYALVSFIIIPLTAMRMQKIISYGMLAATVFSLLAGKLFVSAHGVMGASMLYLFLNILLAVYLTVCFNVVARRASVGIDMPGKNDSN